MGEQPNPAKFDENSTENVPTTTLTPSTTPTPIFPLKSTGGKGGKRHAKCKISVGHKTGAPTPTLQHWPQSNPEIRRGALYILENVYSIQNPESGIRKRSSSVPAKYTHRSIFENAARSPLFVYCWVPCCVNWGGGGQLMEPLSWGQ